MSEYGLRTTYALVHIKRVICTGPTYSLEEQVEDSYSLWQPWQVPCLALPILFADTACAVWTHGRTDDCPNTYSDSTMSVSCGFDM